MDYTHFSGCEFLQDSIIRSLNDLQQQATLFSYEDLLQIKAPPGSGKTKIIISRLLYLIICCKVPANQIIVTTFGKKASLEIKERLNEALFELKLDDTIKNETLLQLKVGTFHGLCLAMLKQYGHLIGIQRVEILSESEQENIIKKGIKKLPDNIYDYYKYKQNKVNLMTPVKQQKKKKKNKTSKDSNGQESIDEVNDEQTLFASVEINEKHWAFDVGLILKNISKLKSQGLTCSKYVQTGGDLLDQALLYFYDFYETESKKLMKLDFDDLLLQTYLLMKAHRDAIPFSKHILVDEFQDTSFLQLQIVLLWSSKQKTGITVVGDPNQCIYAFRDASPSNFKDMIKLCDSQVQIIPLNQNYRSSQKIIDCCQYVLNPSQAMDEDPLCGQFDSEYGPVYMSFKHFTAEAQYIANEITYLKNLPGNPVNFSDMAILTRTKRQVHVIEKKLLAYRIPYRIIGNNGFLQRKEVLYFLNLLKLTLYFNSADVPIVNDKKMWLLESLSFVENVGIGKTSLSNLSRFFDSNPVKDPITLIINAPQIDQIISNTKGRSYLMNFIKKFLRNSSAYSDKLDGSSEGLSAFLEYIYKKSGLAKMFIIDNEDSDDKDTNEEKKAKKEEKIEYDPRHFSIESLKELILNFRVKTDETQIDNPVFNKEFLFEFISSINLYAVDTDVIDDEELDKEDKVTICTVHKSKGLEWPVVFVPGCSEDYIPCIFMDEVNGDGGTEDEDDPSKSSISFEKYKSNNVSFQEKLNEERRIFYVALSRAKHLLYMTSIERTEEDSNAKIRPMIRSRFIDEELIKKLKRYPNLFSDIKLIKQFYSSLNKSIDESNSEFSLPQLVKDYNQYFKRGCSEFVWMGHEVFNINTINLKKNKLNSSSFFSGTNFMSARDHIDLGLSNKEKEDIVDVKMKKKRNVTIKNKPRYDIGNMFSSKGISAKNSIPDPLPASQFAPANLSNISKAILTNKNFAPVLSTQINRSSTKQLNFISKNDNDVSMSAERKTQIPVLNKENKHPFKRERKLIKEDLQDDIPQSKKPKFKILDFVAEAHDDSSVLAAQSLAEPKIVFGQNSNADPPKSKSIKPRVTIDNMFKTPRLKKIKYETDAEIIILSD
ncbi:hypothetical protein QEN19_001322 [Hanseniaspora menglaensis]